MYFVGDYWPGKESRFYEDGQYYGKVLTYKPSDKLKVKVVFAEVRSDSLYTEVVIENPYRKAINYEEEYFFVFRYLEDGKRTNGIHKPAGIKLSKDPDQVYRVQVPLPESPNVDAFSFSIRHGNLPAGSMFYNYPFPPAEK